MSELQFRDYDLNEEIIKALDVLGYHSPTEVQSKVIPAALKGQDLIVKSQTGSGKTASFGIPVCELVDWAENKPQVLVLTPTRELAAQVKEDITNIGRFKRIKAVALFGKQPFAPQKIELTQKTHVVVGTPGRVFDHIERGTLPLNRIKTLVIDEADEMLSMGFIEQIEKIIQQLPRERVTMLFSATLPEAVKNLCRKYMTQPLDIEIEAAGLTTASIEHALIEVRQAAKFALLLDLLTVENPDSCIIFCRTQDQVNALFRGMADQELPVDKIHGGMMQDERFEVMNAFKRGQFRYLIATDVAARGIDIENITHVINYDIPMEKESYVHRTGRTARAGKSGKAITLVTPNEHKWVADIEGYIGFSIPVMKAPSEDAVAYAKPAFEQKLGKQQVRKVGKTEVMNQNIMKLYFNGGKKKKLRAVDFVGTIAKLEGITADDIGIITIQDNVTYVDILNGKGALVLQAMRETTVKGKLLKVHIAKK
ncbi:ATP-dependent RNA helicase DbpA [Paenibacillus auburnensis]|uniref:ATP-dependent RNA helicase DbpA n=1 Tax=Paenibacillus auburnensis TaxID=2905649 RepID=A0ABN8FQ65_9BACL|nr:DEAD/DEAH box helicase [Paenibacillus auburnensis]CAH1190131.1 ATP-dependent RNA helicase DbpA [Paenibacillus auburnensis]